MNATQLRESLENHYGRQLRITTNHSKLMIGQLNLTIPFKGRNPLINGAQDLFQKRREMKAGGNLDRNLHPIAMIGGCPGIGKTRALIEMGNALKEFEEISGRHLVNIAISYNNGNPPTYENEMTSPTGLFRAFDLRVLYFTFFADEESSYNGKETESYNGFNEFAKQFPTKILEQLTALLIIDLIYLIISEELQVEYERISVFIAVDELNYLLPSDYNGSREGRALLRNTIIEFGAMQLPKKANQFVFGAVAGTIFHPIKQVFAESSYPVKPLPIGMLSMDQIEQLMDNYEQTHKGWNNWRMSRALRILLEDFASLPRLAENLLRYIDESLIQQPSLEAVDYNMIHLKMISHLPLMIEDPSVIEHLVIDCTIGRTIERNFNIGRSAITYEDLERSGMIIIATREFSKQGFVQLPFCFFRHFVGSLLGTDPLTQVLRSLCDASESELTWQMFEEFHARIEALREMILARSGAKYMSMEKFYCVESDNRSFCLPCLYDLQLRSEVQFTIAKKRFPPKAPGQLDFTTIQDQDGKAIDASLSFVVNAPGALFDGYTLRHSRCQPFDYYGEEEEEDGEEEGVDIESKAKRMRIETEDVLCCSQTKLYKCTEVTGDIISEEATKVEDRLKNQRYVLIVVATKLSGSALDNLPMNSIVLHGSAFKEFYGPIFASRACLFASRSTVNVNTANRFELMTIEGIGEVMAKNIIQCRQQKAFTNVDDLFKRVRRLPMKIQPCLAF